MASASNDAKLGAPCKKCKNKVVTGLKCETCSQMFHRSCAKLCTKILNDNTFKCCENSDQNISITDSDFWETLDGAEIDSRVMSYIIKQKDLIIEQQQQQIILLKSQLEKMTPMQSPMTSDKNPEAKKNEAKPNINKKQGGKEAQKTTLIPQNNNITKKTEKEIESHIKNSESGKFPKAEWKVVSPKRKRSYRKPVVGCLPETSSIQAIPRSAYIHVYRLHPDTAAEDLKNFLNQKVSVKEVVKLDSKHPELYSSFKVGVDYVELESAMNPELWPKGACVNKFFHWIAHNKQVT
ncbi:hypothetical protein Zmor_018625 [Zophobas morio]|uniref:Uncharacterized protein n=1 Tax=Zophobas morio TaxID=2755281 RepID=A0AA38ICV0_9CUCU|nr:hypothetical protein Zmor_018625 [Zophobas morio]